MKYRVEVDQARCQSHGKCLSVAPRAFVWTREKKARINDLEAATDEAILVASKICPYRAITVSDGTSGERIFPLPVPPAAKRGSTG
jgi:ferredoxin